MTCQCTEYQASSKTAHSNARLLTLNKFNYTESIKNYQGGRGAKIPVISLTQKINGIMSLNKIKWVSKTLLITLNLYHSELHILYEEQKVHEKYN